MVWPSVRRRRGAINTFRYIQPKNISGLKSVVPDNDSDYVIVGGGTDVLLKIKRNVYHPEEVIGLSAVEEIQHVERGKGVLKIGAALKLADVISSKEISEELPSLVSACKRIASPQLRNMATIGGNVCLSPRCEYYDQVVWAGGFEECYKRGGDLCHVVRGGEGCYAVSCADTPPVLIALDAQVEIEGGHGRRKIFLEDLYRNDGRDYLTINRGEVVSQVVVPLDDSRSCVYNRYSMRGAIDFPIVGVAVSVSDSADECTRSFKVVVTGLQASPVRMESLEQSIGEKRNASNYSGSEVWRAIDEEVDKLRCFRHGVLSNRFKKRTVKMLLRSGMNQLHEGWGNGEGD